jgi:hypothetical protein
MGQTEVESALRQNARKRHQTEARLQQLRDEADILVLNAVEAGVPKLTVARLAGLARQSVYNILERGGRG